MQQLHRQRCARQLGHAHRRGVDQPVRLGQGRGQVGADHGAPGTEVGIQVVHQGLCTGRVHFEQYQPLDPFTQQGMGHGRTGTTGTHLHHLAPCHIRQATAQAFGKTQAVGVVADPLAVLEHHGVHRADAAGFVRQFVEQRQDRLLERVGDVEPGETGVLGGVEQAGQGAVVQLQLVGIDQPVQVAQRLGITFVFVQGRGA
ncbi:hypothetical protein D3C81_1113100 [compost metagenome]